MIARPPRRRRPEPPAAPPAAPPPAAEWVLCGLAAEILGASRPVVRRLASLGLIGRRALPGAKPRFRRADVERLAKEHTSPAPTPAAG